MDALLIRFIFQLAGLQFVKATEDNGVLTVHAHDGTVVTIAADRSISVAGNSKEAVFAAFAEALAPEPIGPRSLADFGGKRSDVA